jgi:hypothetical protein
MVQMMVHVITKNFEGFAGKSPCTADAGAVPLTIPITNPRHGDRRFQDEHADNHNPLTWETPGLNDRLIALHGDKGADFSTFEQIACQLSDEFEMHITKSACVGRARRLGLPQRLLFVRRVKVKAPPKPVTVARIEEQTSEPRLVTIFELEHGECRWPFGDEAPFLFCGLPVHKQSSWCRKHHKMVYQR